MMINNNTIHSKNSLDHFLLKVFNKNIWKPMIYHQKILIALALILNTFSIPKIYGQSSSINPTNGCINCSTDADDSAVLDIRSTSKGVLIPRMTAAERDAIANPSIGLFVYVTDDNHFYHWTGTKWSTNTGAQGPAGPAGETGSAGPVATAVLNNIQDQLIQPSSPNGNIIIGEFAGVDLSLGEFDFQGKRNTLIGSNVGFKLTTGSDNTLLGNFSGSRLTTASGNTFLGARAGELCTIGSQNTFIGRNAGAYTNGFHNIAIGDLSLIYGTGSNNVAIGNSSGEHSESSHNVFIGHEAGQGKQNAPNLGAQNTFVGSLSGKANSSGSFNSFYGHSSGNSNMDGLGNAFFGYSSGGTNSTGSSNTFLGGWAGRDNQSGSDNVYIGANAGSFSNAASNVYIGFGSGRTSLGANNTFIGFQSGRNCTGANNILIGTRAGFAETKSNVLIIENSDSSTPLIYGEFDNDKVQINGALHISEFARLIPSFTPSLPEKGTMYYDSLDNKVKVWTGTTWENLSFTSSAQAENSFTKNNESPCNTSCLEESQKLKMRVAQLEAKLKKFDAIESKLEKLASQLSVNPTMTQRIEISKLARLEQNIPNPFYSATKIQYFLPEDSRNSKINIYNISGQIVKVIKLEGSGKGEINVQIDEFSRGLYHYSLEVDGKIIDTKKMSSIK